MIRLGDILIPEDGRRFRLVSPPREAAGEALRRTFQRTEEFCDEAQKYMDLVAKEEADARRPGYGFLGGL